MKRDKANEILDITEKMVRAGGYNSFSFRDIAQQVGVKSASVHYHFPTKEELGAALAKRYTDRFLEALGDAESFTSAQSAITHYIELYRRAFFEDGLMCLCGAMGAESRILPESVRLEVKVFFETNLHWLEKALDKNDGPKSEEIRKSEAIKIIALLEGAMIIAQLLGDGRYFEDVATRIIEPSD